MCPRAGLGAVKKRKITCTFRESKGNKMKVKRREIRGAIIRQEKEEDKRRGSK
jgi:hypothetical protein